MKNPWTCDNVHADLADFCEANHGAPKVRVTMEALRFFIEAEVAKSPTLRRQMDEMRQRRVQREATRLSKVTSISGNK